MTRATPSGGHHSIVGQSFYCEQSAWHYIVDTYRSLPEGSGVILNFGDPHCYYGDPFAKMGTPLQRVLLTSIESFDLFLVTGSYFSELL